MATRAEQATARFYWIARSGIFELGMRGVVRPVLLLLLSTVACGDDADTESDAATPPVAFDGGMGTRPTPPDDPPLACAPRSLLAVYSPLAASTDDPLPPERVIDLETPDGPLHVSAAMLSLRSVCPELMGEDLPLECRGLLLLSSGSTFYALKADFTIEEFGVARDVSGNLIAPDHLFAGALTGGMFGPELRVLATAGGQFGSPITPLRADVSGIPLPFRPRSLFYLDIPPLAFLLAVTDAGRVLSAQVNGSRDVFLPSFVESRTPEPTATPVDILQVVTIEPPGRFGALDTSRVFYEYLFPPDNAFARRARLDAAERVDASRPPRATVFIPSTQQLLLVEDVRCDP